MLLSQFYKAPHPAPKAHKKNFFYKNYPVHMHASLHAEGWGITPI